MKLSSLLRNVTTAALLGGCSSRGLKGDGHVTTEKRSRPEFTEIQANGTFDIKWSSGSPTVTITTDQNLLPHIHTEVAGNTLQISTDTPLSTTEGIKIVVNSAALKRAETNGAIHFAAQKVTGSAFTALVTGSSTVELDGAVTDLVANLTGASRLNAQSLAAKSVKVSMVGASSADVAAEDTLKANVTGASALTYSGQPSVEQEVTGAASIQHK